MLIHAILAAGRGTRLFGEMGGNKAMAAVGDGHLIDYVVREAETLGPVATLLLLAESDARTAARVQQFTASSIVSIPSPSDGTGPGVRRLLEHDIEGPTIILSTCDLVADEGVLAEFFAQAIDAVSVADARCVVATSIRDVEDPVPIFVHADDGVVKMYGKDAPPSDRTFAGARVMNSAFRSVLLESDPHLTTDTQMMSARVATVPGTVLHLDVPGLFDVDDQRALTRAELLTRGDPVG